MKYFESFLETASQQSPLKQRKRGECYPRDLYDPGAARAYAENDETLTPEQRASLLHYAHEAESVASSALV